MTMDITSKHIQKHFWIKEISWTRKVQSQLMAKVMHEWINHEHIAVPVEYWFSKKWKVWVCQIDLCNIVFSFYQKVEILLLSFFFFFIYVKSILLIDFMNTCMVNDETWTLTLALHTPQALILMKLLSCQRCTMVTFIFIFKCT